MPDNERHIDNRFEKRLFLHKAVVPEVGSMVGKENDDGVVQQTFTAHPIEQPAKQRVQKTDLTKVTLSQLSYLFAGQSGSVRAFAEFFGQPIRTAFREIRAARELYAGIHHAVKGCGRADGCVRAVEGHSQKEGVVPRPFGKPIHGLPDRHGLGGFLGRGGKPAAEDPRDGARIQVCYAIRRSGRDAFRRGGTSAPARKPAPV